MANIHISLFDKAKHDRTGFSCGVDSIDRWFKYSISKKIKNDRVRVWCGVNDDGVLVGFYALSTYSALPEHAGNIAIADDIHEIPTIYLSLLAVDKTQQGQGGGGDLLMHAIEKCVMVSNHIGVSEIVLDVEKDDGFDRRVQFYNSYGFRFIEEESLRMALSVKDAKANIQTAL